MHCQEPSLNSPGASTSGNPNANRTSRPKAKKKGKRSNNSKKDVPGTQEELDAGWIVDPSGSIDPPHQNSELDKSNENREELDKTMKKYFACRYCDQSYEWHDEWESVLQEHKDIYHPTLTGNPVTSEDWYLINE